MLAKEKKTTGTNRHSIAIRRRDYRFTTKNKITYVVQAPNVRHLRQSGKSHSQDKANDRKTS